MQKELTTDWSWIPDQVGNDELVLDSRFRGNDDNGVEVTGRILI